MRKGKNMRNELSLYELSSEFCAIADRMRAEDWDDDTLRDTLEGLSLPVEEKAKNVALYIKTLSANEGAISGAAQQLLERAKSMSAQRDRLHRYLLDNMLRCGISKIESPIVSIVIRKNPPAVDITDEALLPDGYIVDPPPPPPRPDKKLIAADLKAGIDVPGARLIQSERLEIK